MPQPAWVELGLSCLGVKEIRGKPTHPLIARWWQNIRSQIKDDETAWCAAFVGGVLEDSGIASSGSAAARSYRKWGVSLAAPAVGAIVVLWRGSPASPFGHVGFIVGKDSEDNLMVLGGNQKNSVCIAPFDRSRVLAYRWPDGVPLPESPTPVLPLIASDGILSQNEV